MKENESRNGAFLLPRIFPFTNSAKVGVSRRFAIYTKSLTQSRVGDVAVILDSLKKPFDDVAVFVQFVLSEENANMLATVSFILKNFFTAEFNSGK